MNVKDALDPYWEKILRDPGYAAALEAENEIDACHQLIAWIRRQLARHSYPTDRLSNDIQTLEMEVRTIRQAQRSIYPEEDARLEFVWRLLLLWIGVAGSLQAIEQGLPEGEDQYLLGIRDSFRRRQAVRLRNARRQAKAADARRGAAAAAQVKRARVEDAIERFDPMAGSKAHRARLIQKRARQAEERGEFEGARSLPKRLDRHLK